MENNLPLTRLGVWSAVPEQATLVLDGLILPARGAAGETPRGWRYLGQRVPLIGIGLAIGLAGWGLGTAVFAALRVGGDWSRGERWYLASLTGLALWTLLTLGLGLAGLLIPAAHWTLVVLAISAGVSLEWRQQFQVQRLLPAAVGNGVAVGTTPLGTAPRWPWLIVLPFVVVMILGSLSPQTDFDALEYHLQGPKEFYQQGRITWLRHNVYTSFPLLSEMVLLEGMVLTGDWQAGALAGQFALMCCGLWTAVGLYLAGRRWFSPTAGIWAAVVYLSTPWTVRTGLIAGAELSLMSYLFATTFAALLVVDQWQRSATEVGHHSRPTASVLVVGLLAGSAMACKYPGLVQVVVPLAVLLGCGIWRAQGGHAVGGAARTRTIIQVGMWYGLGVLLAIGPWLVRNWHDTGNPVYPLAYRLFGGVDWDPALELRFQRGHSPPYQTWLQRILDLRLRVQDFLGNNDWHSGLLFALAPLAGWWSVANGRSVARQLALYLVWLFFAWWGLTHLIDRFWVPMIPVAALLAGAGFAATQGVTRGVAGAVLAAGLIFNLTICTSGLIGYSAGWSELSRERERIVATISPEIGYLNREFTAGRLPRDFKLLAVGEAALFEARFPVVYNTVFDECWLQQFCVAEPTPDLSTTWPLKSAAEIRATLRAEGITHVLVNWREIMRYRAPMSYGYTNFATPERFAELRQLGVLGPPSRWPAGMGVGELSEDRRAVLKGWGEALILPGGVEYTTSQLFPVIGDTDH